MQNLRVIATKSQGFSSYRNISTDPKDLFKSIADRIRTFIHGSPNPYISSDRIYEEMMADRKKVETLKRHLAKTLYTRKKSLARLVKNTDRVKELEPKITGKN
ncbi:hypothetical protein QR98_0005060 [Sarcoptes scabiei]|uniref:Uncharacterized protein n=1 Tax=Sarcoptes scabiei TaxID=52283 RepID=A0A131ZVK1_SARSC|nr:hypothetical protein QR98_0005060 [Sarcoptes scabiei]